MFDFMLKFIFIIMYFGNAHCTSLSIDYSLQAIDRLPGALIL